MTAETEEREFGASLVERQEKREREREREKERERDGDPSVSFSCLRRPFALGGASLEVRKPSLAPSFSFVFLAAHPSL